MDHYELGDVTVTDPSLFDNLNLPPTNIQMTVRAHSKPRNIIGFAMKKMDREDIETIIWLGAEPEAETVLYCADTMWERHQKLYYLMRTGIRREEEMWNPKDNPSLTGLKVRKEMTYIGILLSKYLIPGTDKEEGYKPCRSDMPKPQRPNHQQHRRQHRNQHQYHSYSEPQTTAKPQHYASHNRIPSAQTHKQHIQRTDADNQPTHQNGHFHKAPHSSHSQVPRTHNGNYKQHGGQYRKPKQPVTRNSAEKAKEAKDEMVQETRNGDTNSSQLAE